MNRCGHESFRNRISKYFQKLVIYPEEYSFLVFWVDARAPALVLRPTANLNIEPYSRRAKDVCTRVSSYDLPCKVTLIFRVYYKRGVQPKFGVQDEKCGVIVLPELVAIVTAGTLREMGRLWKLAHLHQTAHTRMPFPGRKEHPTWRPLTGHAQGLPGRHSQQHCPAR